ncbi:MAG: NAD(P)H-dependent oxidoreductase subunit E [Oscillospiraceae bacterium]
MSIHNFQKVEEICKKNENKKENLIAILQDIQKEYGYLSKEVLYYLSEYIAIPISKIYGVATFYSEFSMEPRGKNLIKICDGTSCYVKKSLPMLHFVKKYLGLTDEKHTTDDLIFTLEPVSCLGCCSVSPAISINDTLYCDMTSEKIVDLITSIRGGN